MLDLDELIADLEEVERAMSRIEDIQSKYFEEEKEEVYDVLVKFREKIETEILEINKIKSMKFNKEFPPYQTEED